MNNYLDKVEFGQHLNGDESMAFGAAFHAANRTNLFRVRPINFYDGNNFETNLIIKNSNPDSPSYARNVTLFGKKDRYDMTKTFGLSYDDNLNIDVMIKEQDKEEYKFA